MPFTEEMLTTEARSSALAAARSRGSSFWDEKERALHVQIDNAVPGLFGELVDGQAPGQAGVVDQHVQPPFALGDGFRQRFAAGDVAQIAGDRGAVAELAQAALGFRAGILLARRDVDAGAGAHQPLGDHQADAPGAAGHQRHLAANAEQMLVEVAHAASLAATADSAGAAPSSSPASPNIAAM